MHYFNTEEKLNYVSLLPDVSCFSVNEISEEERKEFLVWYNNHKSETFDIKLELQTYCQADVTVLRQACRVFRPEFMQLCNIELLLE